MDVTLYSTNCPKCMILESKLKSAQVDYVLVTNEDVMLEKGFKDVPKLEVDGKVMNYIEAIKWLR